MSDTSVSITVCTLPLESHHGQHCGEVSANCAHPDLLTTLARASPSPAGAVERAYPVVPKCTWRVQGCPGCHGKTVRCAQLLRRCRCADACHVCLGGLVSPTDHSDAYCAGSHLGTMRGRPEYATPEGRWVRDTVPSYRQPNHAWQLICDQGCLRPPPPPPGSARVRPRHCAAAGDFNAVDLSAPCASTDAVTHSGASQTLNGSAASRGRSAGGGGMSPHRQRRRAVAQASSTGPPLQDPAFLRSELHLQAIQSKPILPRGDLSALMLEGARPWQCHSAQWPSSCSDHGIALCLAALPSACQATSEPSRLNVMTGT